MKRTAALFMLLVIPAAAHGQQAARADVPVSSVVLFSSGVGYFEHSGTVRGGAATELRFRTAQLNDVIKSLVLQDLDGGKVNAITYPSQDPLSKTLKSFQVDITANPGMAQLLNQLRGSRVSLQYQAERIGGTILGVEMRSQMHAQRDAVIEIPVLNLVSGGTIRSVELQSVTSLTLEDPQLQEELTKALTSLTQSRDQDKKPVLIDFAGAGNRRVKVGYVVEAPVWKTSYRLILEGATAKLQGWGIIENQTESDWNNVSLSLVSGRPISFMMDLYSPLYINRPTVTPELYAQLRPQVYGGGIASAADSAIGGAGSAAQAAARARAANERRLGYDAQGRPMANALSEVVATAMNAAASVESRAETQELGELFEFTVRNVTLPRQKSAMIPIVAENIEAERVSIYNAAVMLNNPLNGVRLKNSTGKSLLQGPVTVIDRDNYAGDARIGDLPAGQERLLSYGIDLEVLVNSTTERSTEAVTTARIERGLLTVERRVQSSRDYVVDNKSARPRVIIVEHPVRDGWKLVDSPAPYESTPSVHRFRVVVPAGKKVTTTIHERWNAGETIALANFNVESLVQYTTTGQIPKAVRTALERAVEMRRNVKDLETQVAARTQRINEVTVEQSRMRENMKVVGQASQYYDRLLGKLNEQESEIERLQRDRDALGARLAAAREQLRDYLANLTVT